MSPTLLSAGRLAGTSLLRLQTDRRLVDLVRAGNDDAFAVVAARYRGELVRHAERLVGTDRAEDAVQQALLNAHRALRRPAADVADVRPWLHRIVRNVALNVLRQPGGSDEPLDERLAGGESPAQAYERRQRLATTIAAVGALPERQRRAMLMRELDGLSHVEIARELGVAPGAARQLIHRARHSVRAAASAMLPIGLFLPRSAGVAGGPAGTAGGGAAAGIAGLGAKVCVTLAVAAGAVGVAAGEPSLRRGIDAIRPGGAPAAGGPSSGRSPEIAQVAAVGRVQAPAPARAGEGTGLAADGEAQLSDGFPASGSGRERPGEAWPLAGSRDDGEARAPASRSPAAEGERTAGRRDGGGPGAGPEQTGGRPRSDGREERSEDAGSDSREAADDAEDTADDRADAAEDAADDAADAAEESADDRADAAEDAADDAADAAEGTADDRANADDDAADEAASPEPDEDADDD